MLHDAQVRSLIQSARQASQSGRTVEAEQFRRQAEILAPRHPSVLNETAIGLIQSGRFADAEKLLAEAIRGEPANAELLYNRAIALRKLGKIDEAAQALSRALAIEPGNMSALFEKASVEEQQGNSRQAAMTYATALRMLPANFKPPKWMEEPLKRAKGAADANNKALEAYIEDGLAPLRKRYAPGSLRRFDRCVEALLQKRKMFRQQPTFMCYPEMPSIEFYDRGAFPWLDDLEAAADGIRAELLEVMGEGQSILEPYVADQRGLDVRYYKELNRSRRWGVYPFWREGTEYPDHIARCPRTAAALKSWPKWDVPGSGPTALFSILDAKTRIPSHSGPTNTRLVVHLGLVIPPGCGFRVGGQTIEWEPGKAFVFDDTINHEAWNDSDEPRAVLIVDTWSPILTETEREMIRSLTERMHRWYGPDSGRDLEPGRTNA